MDLTTAENVIKYEEQLKAANIDSRIIIDCNHENSGKDPYKQPEVLKLSKNRKKLVINQSVDS